MRPTLPFVLLTTLITGCAMNSVRPLSAASFIPANRAVVIYGVGVEGRWDSPMFGAQLVEYSVKDQQGKGNCFIFNRTKALVPSTPGPVRYFAFDVPPGHYAYSPFLLGALAHKGNQAFLAPEGQVVYFGDFVYSKNGQVEYRQDFASMEKALPGLLPDFKGKVLAAESVAAKPPRMVLCTF